VPYVGLVAGQARGREVLASLEVGDDLRSRVRTPAGLDIGARTAHEVALSILAEIVALRPRTPLGTERFRAEGPPAGVAGVDPVCGMTVAGGADALRFDHEGDVVWFCGRGCLQAFAADPAAYAR
jgi:xanthine dehydrogenase accessory factor